MIDLLGEGEMFGHRSMITGEPVSLAVSAHADTVCYRLPEHVLRPVLAQASVLRVRPTRRAVLNVASATPALRSPLDPSRNHRALRLTTKLILKRS